MGRHSIYNKRKLVTYDPSTRISKCLLCDKAMKGNLLGNIKRHYVRIHNYNFDAETQPRRVEQNPIKEKPFKVETTTNQLIANNFAVATSFISSAAAPSCASTSGGAAATATAYGSSTTATFKLNKHEFQKCCVGLVIESNIPFRLFDDTKYFKRIMEPYEKAFNLNLNAIKVEELSYAYADDVKEHLRALLEKKLITLKLELATHQERFIACLNVQFMRDFRLQNLTLGIMELKKRNYGALKNEILKLLSDFNIDLTQIYAFITDSAAQCLLGKQHLEQELLRLQDYENVEQADDDVDDEHEDEACEAAENENENFIKIDMKMQEAFQPHALGYVVHAIGKAALDCFEIFKTQIESCRAHVKHLRQAQQIQPNNLRRPEMDRSCSWFSTYNMIESLYFLKEFINTDSMDVAAASSQVDWYFLETFLEAFKPLLECAQQLLNEQYVIGDFFRDWLLCETKLERILKNACAKSLYDCMQQRKLVFMENEHFLAALYFDPRFNFMGSPFFDDEKRRTAALFILDLNTRVTTMVGNANEMPNASLDETSTASAAAAAAAASDDPYGALELKLSMSTNLTADDTSKLCVKIENLAYGQRMPFSTNVLDYWKMQTFKEKDLAQLAQAVFIAPANQFTIKRAVDALANLLSNQRLNLNADTLRNLSFIKLNKDVFESI